LNPLEQNQATKTPYRSNSLLMVQSYVHWCCRL